MSKRRPFAAIKGMESEEHKRHKQRQQKREWARDRRRKEKEYLELLRQERKELQEYNSKLRSEVEKYRDKERQQLLELCKIRTSSLRRMSVPTISSAKVKQELSHLEDVVTVTSGPSSRVFKDLSARYSAGGRPGVPQRHMSDGLLETSTSAAARRSIHDALADFVPVTKYFTHDDVCTLSQQSLGTRDSITLSPSSAGSYSGGTTLSQLSLNSKSSEPHMSQRSVNSLEGSPAPMSQSQSLFGTENDGCDMLEDSPSTNTKFSLGSFSQPSFDETKSSFGSLSQSNVVDAKVTFDPFSSLEETKSRYDLFSESVAGTKGESDLSQCQSPGTDNRGSVNLSQSPVKIENPDDRRNICRGSEPLPVTSAMSMTSTSSMTSAILTASAKSTRSWTKMTLAMPLTSPMKTTSIRGRPSFCRETPATVTSETAGSPQEMPDIKTLIHIYGIGKDDEEPHFQSSIPPSGSVRTLPSSLDVPSVSDLLQSGDDDDAEFTSASHSSSVRMNAAKRTAVEGKSPAKHAHNITAERMTFSETKPLKMVKITSPVKVVPTGKPTLNSGSFSHEKEQNTERTRAGFVPVWQGRIAPLSAAKTEARHMQADVVRTVVNSEVEPFNLNVSSAQPSGGRTEVKWVKEEPPLVHTEPHEDSSRIRSLLQVYDLSAASDFDFEPKVQVMAISR